MYRYNIGATSSCNITYCHIPAGLKQGVEIRQNSSQQIKSILHSFSKEMATDRELALDVLNKHIRDSSSRLNRCEFINTSSIYIIASFWEKYLGRPETFCL